MLIHDHVEGVSLIQVILSYPNGRTQEVLLAGVPRVGEHIRTSNGPMAAPSYVVEHVLWVEGSGSAPEPTVVVVVHPHAEGPPG